MSRLIALVMVFVLAAGLVSAPSALAQASKENVVPEATNKGIVGQIIAKQPAGSK